MSDLGIKARYTSVVHRIREACAACGRDPREVRLVAVSKRHPLEAIQKLRDIGHLDFGENYVNEWRAKADSAKVRWHFIGPLQSNKLRYLANTGTLIHTIDRAKLVEELARRSRSAQEVLIQVNIGNEPQKAGCAPAELEALIESLAAHPQMRLRGLMAIPPAATNPEDARPYFRQLAGLLPKARGHWSLLGRDPADVNELSMGMSGDMHVAIEEGATIVRVGTAIFGTRPD